ncbi:unnamed protein product [Didymodactylos carnosus]|uniref:Uncharacterized protein n=1 Tax=Didymodactylos carnosus TaxID=1234261 RepID=A0A814RJ46_9BILA|nr:unnamed protein product [Didymodactylos carnosus]CAF1134654.1 unnamed protein product [Didymodactylos carnosus]CAF3898403.1 unnamed protein product [Didymodactylos carnosus]CAF3917052.1 unnamed protein product [Didymodactylos carnosus]
MSTTGSQGRRFFSSNLREKIIELIPKSHQDNVRMLMKLYSLILRAVSSSRMIDLTTYRKATMGFTLFIAAELPFVKYNITVHNLIFHSCELIEINNGKALGKLSEESLKSSNKDVRDFREHLARKSDHLSNLSDIFKRLFLRSDLIIRYEISSSIRKRKDEPGTFPTCLSEDDTLLNLLFLDN